MNNYRKDFNAIYTNSTDEYKSFNIKSDKHKTGNESKENKKEIDSVISPNYTYTTMNVHRKSNRPAVSKKDVHTINNKNQYISIKEAKELKRAVQLEAEKRLFTSS